MLYRSALLCALVGSSSAFSLNAGCFRSPQMARIDGPKMMPPGYPPPDDWWEFRHGRGSTELRPLGGAGWAEPRGDRRPTLATPSVVAAVEPVAVVEPVAAPVEAVAAPVEGVVAPVEPVAPPPAVPYSESQVAVNWAAAVGGPRGPTSDAWRFNVQDASPRPMGGA